MTRPARLTTAADILNAMDKTVTGSATSIGKRVQSRALPGASQEDVYVEVLLFARILKLSSASCVETDMRALTAQPSRRPRAIEKLLAFPAFPACLGTLQEEITMRALSNSA